MEKNSAKISLGTAVCMFIILLLIIALAVVYYFGFIKYTERIANTDVAGNKEGMQTVNIINKDMDNINDATNSNISNTNEPVDNTFKTYQENYKNGYKKYIEGENRIQISPDPIFELPGVESIYVDSNNDAYFTFVNESNLYKKYGAKYKVETNVANVYLCPVGTAGYVDAVFLKLDGTASNIHGYELDENPVIKSNILENVKNAVNVVTYAYRMYNENGELGASGPEYVFIDINGNWIFGLEKP